MPTITQVGNSSNSYTLSSIKLDEFLPIVRFNDPRHYVVEGEELVHSKEDAELSKYLDRDKTKFKILQLTTEKRELKLPFTVKQGKGKKGSWFQDDDGYIEVESSTKGAEIKGIKRNKEHQYILGDNVFAKYGDSLELIITITSKESKEFHLDFYANDDENDYMKGDYENVHCGRLKVEFVVFDDDVFREEEIKRLLADNKKAQIFNNTGNVVGNGYCINTADRGLGALLDDIENFYTEPNLIAQGGNGIRLESSSIRAKVIESLGYIENFKEVITDKYNSETFDPPTKLDSSLKDLIKKDVNNRKGYHVYYFSMHGEYHVMLLLINFTDPNNPKFSILDQGYVDRNNNSRNLDFNKIDKIFLNLAKDFWNNKNKNAKNILLWKVKRNQ